MIKGAVPQLIEFLKDSSSRIRLAAENAIGKLAEQNRRLGLLKDPFLDTLLSSLISSLKTDSPAAQSSAMNVLSNLPSDGQVTPCNHTTIADMIAFSTCRPS
jgi:HEAT repeat protein